MKTPIEQLFHQPKYFSGKQDRTSERQQRPKQITNGTPCIANIGRRLWKTRAQLTNRFYKSKKLSKLPALEPGRPCGPSETGTSCELCWATNFWDPTLSVCRFKLPSPDASSTLNECSFSRALFFVHDCRPALKSTKIDDIMLFYYDDWKRVQTKLRLILLLAARSAVRISSFCGL